MELIRRIFNLGEAIFKIVVGITTIYYFGSIVITATKFIAVVLCITFWIWIAKPFLFEYLERGNERN